LHGKPNRFIISPSEALKWANSYESSRTYIAKLNSDKDRKAQYLYYYCQWSKLLPDDLIKLKMNPDPVHYVDAERLLDRFTIEEVDMPECSKWNIANTVRGFFTKNYHRLEQAGKVEYTTQKPQRIPSKEERFSLYKACYTPRDKALMMVPLCSAIALETLSCLRFNMFEDGWMQQEIPHIMIGGEFLKGHNRGKYKGTKQLTFITPETKKALIEYRDWYTRTFGFIWQRDSYVFMDIGGHVGKRLGKHGISEAIGEIQRRSGVGFSTHDGRRVTQTALEAADCPPNWIKKVKGRKVSGEESPYSKPCVEQLRVKYREALGDLQFLGAGFNEGKPQLCDDDLDVIKAFLQAAKAGRLQFKPEGAGSL
jgi:hypothetical protein